MNAQPESDTSMEALNQFLAHETACVSSVSCIIILEKLVFLALFVGHDWYRYP